MKTINLIILIMGVVLLSLGSCKKNKTISPPVTSTMQEFFNDFKEESQQFNISAEQSSLIEGKKGILINIKPNSFSDMNGQKVTGNIDIELVEIFEKSEMFRSNRPTNAMGNPNDPSDDALLVSGGEFYINATQNGQDLMLDKNIDIRIPTGNPVNNMQVFKGNVNNETGINWTLDPDITVGSYQCYLSAPGWFYSFPLDSLGWINCDYFLNQNEPSTDLNINLSGVGGMTDSNTVVTIVLTNDNAIGVCPLDIFSITSTSVNAKYYFSNTPIGTAFSLLAVSKVNNDYYYDLISSTISNNLPHVENLQMQPISLAQLTTIIDNL